VAHAGLIVTGGVLLFFGLIGFFYPLGQGYTAPKIHQICSTDWAQFGLLFDEEGDFRQKCNEWLMITTAIYGIGLIGIILIIVGAVKKSENS